MGDETMEDFFNQMQLTDFAVSIIKDYEATKNVDFGEEDLQDVVDYLFDAIDMFVPAADADLKTNQKAIVNLITALAIQFMDLVVLDAKLEEHLEDDDDED